jgi:predicted heme/steroid binding protein
MFLFLLMSAPALATAHWSPNDVYKIENVGSGKVLDIAGLFWENGGNLQQWDFGNQDNQKWRIKSVAPGVYKIESELNGRVIDVEESADWNGANVQMWDYAGATNQQWQLWEVSPGIYKIRNCLPKSGRAYAALS